MKKIIQTVAFLALVIIFGGVEADAQNATKIDASISFDFIIGDRYLSSGEYVIRINPGQGGVKNIEIRSKGGEILYMGLALPNGDTGRGRSELVFDRTDGRAVLTKILTERSGFSVPIVDISKLVASAN